MGVIGVVRLAKGRVGYFDELTRIHLTIQNPDKPVIEGMNTTNLKKAVKSGSIELVSGTLDPILNEQPKPAFVTLSDKKEPEQKTEIKLEVKEDVKVNNETIVPAGEQITVSTEDIVQYVNPKDVIEVKAEIVDEGEEEIDSNDEKAKEEVLTEVKNDKKVNSAKKKKNR